VPDKATEDAIQLKPEPGASDQENTILVAHATVHLLTGETFQLLPFQHKEDVKSEVSKLIESWSQSGFLLRGSRLYPWHQVRLIEVTSVEELPASQAAQELLDWQIQDEYRVLDSFWKTKQPQPKEDDKSKSDGDKKTAGDAPAK
jgi:hypothetical protein